MNLSTPEADLKPKAPVNPCSHWYPGHRPFESPEVNNIANYMTTLPALRAYVDLRSYGQMSECASPFLCECGLIKRGVVILESRRRSRTRVSAPRRMLRT